MSLGANDLCRWKMENSSGTILELRHVYVAWHHAISKVQLSPKPSLPYFKATGKISSMYRRWSIVPSSRMINRVFSYPTPLLSGETFAFVEHHLFCRSPHDLQPIFDRFEHCTCHQDQTFSHRRREFLRCFLSESSVVGNLQISFFYFFQNLWELVELFSCVNDILGLVSRFWQQPL